MLNNLATTTTLTLNLSGDPTPGDVVTFGSIASGGSGYTTATGVATTSSGSGTGLTVDITAVSGIITAVAINNDGSGYVATETITITNANASGIKTTGNVGAADASRTAGTYTIGASDYISQASGSAATFSIVVDGSGAATITITDDGTGWIANETITVADAQLGSGGGAALTFDCTAIHDYLSLIHI